jgi:antitoxin CptB
MELEPHAEYNRLCWHSRRGMLELDLMLGPFVRQHYPMLPASSQAHYKRLLECEDQDLFTWFMGREKPPDEELADIVEQILATTRA